MSLFFENIFLLLFSTQMHLKYLYKLKESAKQETWLAKKFKTDYELCTLFRIILTFYKHQSEFNENTFIKFPVDFYFVWSNGKFLQNYTFIVNIQRIFTFKKVKKNFHITLKELYKTSFNFFYFLCPKKFGSCFLNLLPSYNQTSKNFISFGTFLLKFKLNIHSSPNFLSRRTKN